MRVAWTALVVLAGLASMSMRAGAQVDPLAPVPGGANGTNVACIQFGDLNSGAFLGTFLQETVAGWEERQHMKAGVARFEERQRTETLLELADTSRGIGIQFDFDRKRVRTTPLAEPDAWRDLYHMLNATDKDASIDCKALARASSGPSVASSQSQPARSGATTIQFITVKIGSIVKVAPGTKLTATSGPPCPGQPGFFLCPNKFTCAPAGGVCCPGAGACPAGAFCDKFVANACISPSDPAFCQGTGNPLTGISLHCAPGSTCGPGNFCTP